MKLKLTQSGGITGKKMTAAVKSKLKDKDWAELVEAIKKGKVTKRGMDTEYYFLQKEDDAGSNVQIDINSIPAKHTVLFKTLFENLKAAED